MLTEATTARRAIGVALLCTSQVIGIEFRAPHIFSSSTKESARCNFPHLDFNGEGEAACKFYEKCLDGKITFVMPHEGTPLADQVPAAWRNKILHATLKVGDEVLTGADVPPDQYQKLQGLSAMLGLRDPVEAERTFPTLGENGTVQLALQETFWAIRFGIIVDRFGIPWIINCGKAA
jgi:PhnB protein